MKKLLTIASALLLAVSNTNAGLWEDIGGSAFFQNNPGNAWDVSLYGVNNTTSSRESLAKGWGGGARVGYWLSKSVGASLQLDYCDSSWTFASLGIGARGTINLGNIGSVSPYVSAGPGWNIATVSGTKAQSVVAVAGGGATLNLKAVKWCSLFAEYEHITTSPAQDRILFGITKRF